MQGTKVGILRQDYIWILDSDGNSQFDAQDALSYFGGFQSQDIPITGEWNGAGFSKPGVYRPACSCFLLDFDGKSPSNPTVYYFGVPYVSGDIPVVGDWNGTHTSKIGIYRQSTGEWFLDLNGTGVFSNGGQAFYYGGLAGDLPAVGRWKTGATSDQVGIFRTGGYWYLDSNNNHQMGQPFVLGGESGNLPVIGDWSGSLSGINSGNEVGIFEQVYYWVLDSNNDHQFTFPPDYAFPYGGSPGDCRSPAAGVRPRQP